MTTFARTALSVFVVVPALALAACDGDKASTSTEAKAPATIEKVDGKITVGGKEAKVTACKAVKREKGVAAEITLDSGITIASSPLDGMQWKSGDGAFARLECDEMKGSNTTAGSAGELAWATGGLALKCTLPAGPLESDITYDCGSVDRPSNRKPK